MAQNASIGAARVEFRMEPSQKSEVEEAAALLGVTLTAFASQVLLEQARRVKREYLRTRLNDSERDSFMSMMSKPPPPTDALKETLHRKAVL